MMPMMIDSNDSKEADVRKHVTVCDMQRRSIGCSSQPTTVPCRTTSNRHWPTSTSVEAARAGRRWAAVAVSLNATRSPSLPAFHFRVFAVSPPVDFHLRASQFSSTTATSPVASTSFTDRLCTELTAYRLLRNDLYCVGWGVKLYSLTHSLTCPTGWTKKVSHSSGIIIKSY